MECEPLFEPGFYDVPFMNTNEHLRHLLVDRFANSKNRDVLFRYLHILLRKAESVRIFVEAWIDGSFVSNKEEPNDIDVVLLYRGGVHLSSLCPSAQTTFQELQNHKSWKEEYHCDLYLIEIQNDPLKNFYQKWFGSDRENRQKGIVRIIF